MASALAQFTNDITKERAEYGKIACLFGYLFCVVSASTIGRTAADTLFLSNYDSSVLSYMYLPQAAILLSAGLIYQRLCGKFRTDRLAMGVILMAAGLSLISRIVMGFGGLWIFPVVYIGYDVLNFLMIVCFWQFATATMDQRKAKRTIGWVGSGGILGGIVSGFGLKMLVHPLGTENLIFLYTGLQLSSIIFLWIVLRKTSHPSQVFSVRNNSGKTPAQASRFAGGQKQTLFASVPHLKYVAITAGAIVISLTLIDYQFKVILRGALQNEAMAGFMGNFYGYAGLLAFAVQLFVAGRLITKFGVMIALLVFPLALFAGSLAVLFVPILAFAVMVKGSDKVLGDTIYSSVSQLIMFPIPQEWRGRAKGFLDGVVRNGAKGVAAISLIVLSRWLPIQEFSYVILVMIGIGIAAAIKIKKAYLSLLVSTLNASSLTSQEEKLDLADPASRNLLIQTLESPHPTQALYAMNILRNVDGFDLFVHSDKLLRHPSGQVRIEALRWMEGSVPQGMSSVIEPLLVDEDIEVRSQAVLTLASCAEERRLEPLTGYLEAEELSIRSAAVAGLIRHYGIEGMFHAVAALKQLIDSKSEQDRGTVAGLFGKIGIAGFYKPLIPLLQDESVDVRLKALESAAKLCVPELAPYLVEMLNEGPTRLAASEALAAYDPGKAVHLLTPYLADSADGAESSDRLPLHLPRVFEAIGTQEAFDALLKHYPNMPQEMKEKAVEAAVRMKNSRQAYIVDPPYLGSLIALEAGRSREWDDYIATIEGTESGSEVEQAAREYRTRHVYGIFQLLALLCDTSTIRAVFAHLYGADTRQQANAAEVIDQLLTGSLRAEMAKVIAPQPKARVSRDGSSTVQAIRWFSRNGDRWLKQVAEQSDPESLERVDLLRKVALFDGMAGRDMVNIAQSLREYNVRQGATIVAEGQSAESMFIISHGTAAVRKQEQTLGKLGPNDYFGEMAVITGRMRTATVVAETDMRLLELASDELFEILFDRTEIAISMMLLLSRRLRVANERATGNRLADQKTAARTTTDEAAAARMESASTATSLADEALLSQGKNERIIHRILVLQKIGLFANCSHDDFVKLAQMAEETAYKPGEAVCRTGDGGDAMYGIIEGQIRVHKGPEELAVLGAGQYFGEMAIIDGEPRSADCTAIAHTVLLEIGRDQVLDFCFQQKHVLRGMMRVLAERVESTQQRPSR
jgi:CRP-like cAMP-binding protein/ATP/ADP translocase/HEAT repeat protein